MPKKTKKEKIIAEYRRKIASFSHSDRPMALSVEETAEKEPQKQTFAYASPLTHTPKTHLQSTLTLDPKEFSAIKKDLLWTLMLTTTIIMGEIGLWKVLG